MIISEQMNLLFHSGQCRDQSRVASVASGPGGLRDRRRNLALLCAESRPSLEDACGGTVPEITNALISDYAKRQLTLVIQFFNYPGDGT